MEAVTLHQSEVGAFRVWVLDDRAKERQRIAKSFEAIGAIAEYDGSIARIGAHVLDIREHVRRAPDIVVLDQHWDVNFESLELLGRSDIETPTPQSVGLGLGRYIRSEPRLSDTIILMTSVNSEDVAQAPSELSPVHAVAKSKIRDMPEVLRATGSQRSALASVGIEADSFSEIRRTRKILIYAARALGLGDAAAPALAGLRQGVGQIRDAFRDHIWYSRDARERANHLSTILTLLREAYGSDLPGIDRVSADFGLNLRAVFLDGSVEDLLHLRVMIETKAGGRA
jgi:hypothetical protein